MEATVTAHPYDTRTFHRIFNPLQFVCTYKHFYSVLYCRVQPINCCTRDGWCSKLFYGLHGIFLFLNEQVCVVTSFFMMNAQTLTIFCFVFLFWYCCIWSMNFFALPTLFSSLIVRFAIIPFASCLVDWFRGMQNSKQESFQKWQNHSSDFFSLMVFHLVSGK